MFPSLEMILDHMPSIDVCIRVVNQPLLGRLYLQCRLQGYIDKALCNSVFGGVYDFHVQQQCTS